MDETPLITVPMPTVTGREDLLQDALDSLLATSTVDLHIVLDGKGCGEAWARGFEEGNGDYFFAGADDITMHPGWWQAAKRVADLGHLPVARVLNTDGSLQSCGRWQTEFPDGYMLTGTGDDFCRSPFFSRAQWEKLRPLVFPFLQIPAIHYFTDNIFSWAGNRLGMRSVVARSYEYTHHLSDVKRGAGTTWERKMQQDHARFIDYTTNY